MFYRLHYILIHASDKKGFNWAILEVVRFNTARERAHI